MLGWIPVGWFIVDRKRKEIDCTFFFGSRDVQLFFPFLATPSSLSCPPSAPLFFFPPFGLYWTTVITLKGLTPFFFLVPPN